MSSGEQMSQERQAKALEAKYYREDVQSEGGLMIGRLQFKQEGRVTNIKDAVSVEPAFRSGLLKAFQS